MKTMNDYPLFLSEDTVADRVGVTRTIWDGIAVVLEEDGLPKIDDMMNGRYWPAVLTFFGQQNWKKISYEDVKG